MPNKGDARLPARLVYFVQGEATGLIKIGSARSMKERMWALQCGSPDRLKVLGVIRDEGGASGLEKALHDTFSDCRRHGEWFAPDARLLEFIRDHASDEAGERQRNIERLCAKAVAFSLTL